jgi:hypothetical protein
LLLYGHFSYFYDVIFEKRERDLCEAKLILNLFDLFRKNSRRKKYSFFVKIKDKVLSIVQIIILKIIKRIDSKIMIKY